jgi:hypothetical protein
MINTSTKEPGREKIWQRSANKLLHLGQAKLIITAAWPFSTHDITRD